MQTLSPSVQNEAEGLQGVGDTAHTETRFAEPFLDGPAPALWAGFAGFVIVFLVGMMLIIRGRVTRPAKARAEAKNKTFFEPAGEDADITFDDEERAAQEQEEDSEPDHWRDEDVAETEVVINREEEEEPEPIAPAKPEKKKSAFAGLFSKKPAPEPEELPEEEVFEEYAAASLPEEPAYEPEPEYQAEAAPAEDVKPHHQPWLHARDEEADEEAKTRIAEAEEAAHAAMKRAEEAEALARDLKRANDEAQNVVTLGLRKQEKALDERAEALIAIEQRLSSLADEFQARIDQVATSAADTLQAAAFYGDEGAPEPPGGVSEDHFAEFANLMGEQFDSLRKEVSGAVERLSRRLDHMPPAPTVHGAPTAARVQLSDLLGDALAPQRFKLAQKLVNGRTADALIVMPGGIAPLAVDARFPVEDFDAWQLSRNAGTETQLRRAVLRHIADVAEKLTAAEDTADCAVMFVPSENILSEMHAHFSELVQESYRARVFMVSPTSLMATLHTISAVLSGAGIREASAVNVIDELHALRNRVAALETQGANGAEKPAAPAEEETPEPEATAYSRPIERPWEADPLREPAHEDDKSSFPLR